MSKIIPPFTRASATAKVLLAQNLWNTKDPAKVALAYTPDSIWRNRATFVKGRPAIAKFLESKWQKEHGYVLKKELFAHDDNRIAVQFWYEWNDKKDLSGQWYRAHGLEHWTFDNDGLMQERRSSINDMPLRSAADRWFVDGKIERGPDPDPEV
ncbi:hypothetical protein HDU87_003485 [Geranomyces variabilis]|uniref:DUF1348-domain-containing protein n=1 Tax=Geranomyces variabilis TaxID=109894 RepID=A0AAD5XRC7_9FUNG|nr:hypothetical protein HDU87_003485 [Geranomyces variabilis]